MTWEPATLDDINAMIDPVVETLDADGRAEWDRIRIAPEKWRCSPYGDEQGGFWAVAIEGSRVLWFDDTEDGFNWSEYSERGVIEPESGVTQGSFEEILEWRSWERSDRGWKTQVPRDLPDELRGPGRIRSRQTTYWDLEGHQGRIFRVHFRTKSEVAFAGPEYPDVALLDEHPLLLDHQIARIGVTFYGRLADPDRLAVRIDEKIRRQTSGWRSLADYANMDPSDMLRGGFGLFMSAPSAICSTVVPMLQAAGLTISPLGESRRMDRRRLLLMGRSYVVAASFAFEER